MSKIFNWWWQSLIPGAFLISVLYTARYWNAFDINAFAYMSVSQIILSSTKILLLLTVSVLSGTGFALLFEDNFTTLYQARFDDMPVAKRIRGIRAFSITVIFCSISGGAIAVHFFNIHYGWSFIGLGLGLSTCYVYVIKINSIEKIFPPSNSNSHLRDTMVAFLSITVFLYVFGAFTYADQDSGRVKDAHAKSLTLSSSDCYTRFIGKAGEYFFFYDLQTKASSIIPADKLSSFGGLSLSMQSCKEMD